MNKKKSATIKAYVNKKQKTIMKRIRLQAGCSYSELARRALYEKYPELRNAE